MHYNTTEHMSIRKHTILDQCLCTVALLQQGSGPAAYTLIGAGPCRGYNDANDNPNRRSMNNVATQAACEAHCDSFTTAPLCTGYAYEAAGAQNCILYGPGMSGSCAAPNAAQTNQGPTACNAVGTCSAPASASGGDNARAYADAASNPFAACQHRAPS